MTLLLIGAVRSIVEMLGLCMLGQSFLYVLAGQNRGKNRIYQLFDLITKAPRRVVANILPISASATVIGVLSFVILLLVWLGLAFIRKSI